MEVAPHNKQGLSEADAQATLAQHGYNEVREEPPSRLRAIVKRLWGPIPWMLEIALVLEVALGKTIEPAIIAGWLAFSAILGGVQERRAQSALDLLRSRLRVNARVCRDGNWRLLPARELVPGDYVTVTTGDLVPADCVIDEGTVDVDQAALTGESTSVSRSKGETIYSGSTVRRGNATGTVAETGARSYFGRTAELVRTASSASHLEQLLFSVVRYLVTIDAVLAAILAIVALWRGEDLLPLVPFFLVLIIATVPVTMPAAFTVANAVEARRLANEGVLVTGLSAVQEAATMDVLCVDKTGTLTQNRQTLAGIAALPGEKDDDVLAWAAAACDEATQGALEVAILGALRKRAIPQHVREKFIPFDPAVKRSEAYVRPDDNGPLVHVVLGSPAVVTSLASSPPEFSTILQVVAATGARVLAVAAGTEGNLRIRGLLALADALREDASALIKTIQSLGIKILMVTGDTVDTAKAISHQVGLGDRFGDATRGLATPLQFDGFANFYPEEKFRLVQSLQRAGRIVGMTGDGVNDAPALKQAEVGIAVQAASDVAKAAAQVVLTHPGLEGVASVVSGGRRVFRRMLTWTITKIARTVELAALLTFGYIATGFFVTPLVLIAVIVVLNDVVTITLATDRSWVSSSPERWNVREIARLGGVLAIGWLILAFVILWFALTRLQLPVPQVQALMFAYLMYSAQATIYLSRTPGRCWSLLPGKFVAAATIGNVVLATVLAAGGFLMAPVSLVLLVAMLGLVLLIALLLDQVKIWLFSKNREEELRQC
ncbi:TPA: HAD-IC family P-type ATPase [Stenotrophomonas maltophilia]|jgi:H+-transporting ATPase|uniref:HAD-IC family P-type ATPase n=3 Tax=Ralstonia TaxID=48736 RepID=UPI001C94BE5A|nr:HAD-IC family P-type ATPase [Ralstonia insidiosa]HDS1363384.1 HAD-IC family P-type ATPase [Stenotrophomonas maltophilia]MBY4704011.1 HAD-IC family P-type ATPase [Ralstonia insidiosa]HEL3837016.1 HAD-IC family P-type ATPase [Stenotrophomonas maltophilia]HEL3845657.1 HAD-IC family P-type ATPase [Stenotrophomonas maltophilia]HEL4293339.1 HAD-IC family P-type ATPase [Stenotrophomonas maltophilia]